MTTKNELVEQIEPLVRTHHEEMRAAAAAAVERGFGTRGHAERGAGTVTSRPEATSRRIAPRRAGEELAGLGERVYAPLCRRARGTMTTVAPQAGASTGAQRGAR